MLVSCIPWTAFKNDCCQRLSRHGDFPVVISISPTKTQRSVFRKNIIIVFSTAENTNRVETSAHRIHCCLVWQRRRNQVGPPWRRAKKTFYSELTFLQYLRSQFIEESSSWQRGVSLPWRVIVVYSQHHERIFRCLVSLRRITLSFHTANRFPWEKKFLKFTTSFDPIERATHVLSCDGIIWRSVWFRRLRGGDTTFVWLLGQMVFLRIVSYLMIVNACVFALLRFLLPLSPK